MSWDVILLCEKPLKKRVQNKKSWIREPSG